MVAKGVLRAARVATVLLSSAGFTRVDSDLSTVGPLQPDASVAARPAQDGYASGLPARVDSDGTVYFLGRRPLADVGEGPLTDDEREVALRGYFQSATGGETEFRLVAGAVRHLQESRLVFVQTHLGVPLLGTYALAKLDGDHLTYARHWVVDPTRIAQQGATPMAPGHTAVDAGAANATASFDMNRHAQAARVTGRPELAWLFHDSRFLLVWDVPVHSDAPYAQWSVFVDATDNTIRGRKKFSFDAVRGHVAAHVEPLCQGDAPRMTPLPFVDWHHEGHHTDADGGFDHGDFLREAQVTLSGPYAKIVAPAGTAVAWSHLLDGAPAHNAVRHEAPPTAQTNAFVHVHQARAWLLRTLGDDLQRHERLQLWTRSQLPVRVDLPSGHKGQSCNAFYDGESLNFFEGDEKLGCNNTGRVAKIVYHEYGHGIHDQLTATRATLHKQVSEGVADYVAATITDDPHITGLLGCETIIQGGPGPRANLRSCRNAYNFCRSRRCSSHPRDEEHNAGPVLCGALWDLREAMVERYGADEGVARADALVLRFLTLVTDMNSAYAAAIAADEDDDNDPSNGTVHSCEINRAFLGQGIDKRAHFPESVKDQVPCVPR